MQSIKEQAKCRNIQPFKTRNNEYCIHEIYDGLIICTGYAKEGNPLRVNMRGAMEIGASDQRTK